MTSLSPVPAVPVARASLALLAVLILSGCQTLGGDATTQRAHLASAEQDSTSLPAEISDFLSDAAPGERRAFDASPWGSPATITAEAHYFAASGRQCRPLAIASPSMNHAPGLACRSNNGWEWVRPVTR